MTVYERRLQRLMANNVELPDFDDMQQVIEGIGNVSREVELVKLEIIKGEARAVREGISDMSLYIGGKQPPISFLEATVKKTGIENELLPLRERLAGLESSLEVLRKSYDLLRIRIEVWRSLQANERASVL